MSPKLNEILLIDDSRADNFLHKRVVESAGVAERVTICFGAREALDYLADKSSGRYPCPDLIFLDINMPGMSGWDFMEAYQKLPTEQCARLVICMLTASYAAEDRKKAEHYGVVGDYIHKPLSVERVNQIVATYFSEDG